MKHPGIDTGSFDSHWGGKEQTVPVSVPLMTGTEVSRITGILTSEGNAASHVRADGNGNMLAVLTDWKP